MIGIELWRARIGLYNSSRRFSSILSSLFSPSRCTHSYYQRRKRKRTVQDSQHTNGESTTRSSLFSSLTLCRFLVLLLLVTAVILVTSCIISVPATSDRPILEQLLVDPHGANMCDSLTSSAQHQSERFALILLKEDMFVEKHLDSDKKTFFRSVLRDWLPQGDNKPSAAVSHTCTWDDTNVSASQAGQDGVLVTSTCVRDSCSSAIAHVSQQLLILSGDVELNPGPKHGVDDEPKMYDLQCMSYTGEDGKATYFRLKERIFRSWREFAYALRFPIHAVESIKPKEEDPVDYFLRKWLQGANKTEDTRPITWGTLIASLCHANFQEEANILEKHFIQVDTVSTQSVPQTSEPDLEADKKKEQLLQTQLEAAKRDRDRSVSQLEKELQLKEEEMLSLKEQLENKDQEILRLKTELQSKENEKTHLTTSSKQDTCDLPSVSISLTPFTTYLKGVYQNTKLQQPFYMCPNSIDEQPFNLHVCLGHKKTTPLDSSNRTKQSLSITDIGKCSKSPTEPAKNILVEGCAGVGKTTLACRLCHEWAKGELLQPWSIVIHVDLRNQQVRQDKTLYELIYHPDQSVRKAVFQELKKLRGQNVLFILDGYDQLSDEQKLTCSVLELLATRNLFPQATLMVLCRPVASNMLPGEFQSNIDQHIEIMEFMEETINSYITSACGENHEIAPAFDKYLSSQSLSYLHMYTPLQCIILTDLYCFHWKNGNKSFAPRTRTELYTDLVRTLLVQYLSSHSEYSKRKWHIVEFTDLPGEVYEQFKALAQLAARGIQERVYMFDSGVPEESLGLMYQVEEVYPGRGRSMSYSFLHLTLQEYLAAYYCSLKNSEDRLKKIIGVRSPLRDFLTLHSKKYLQLHWQVLLFTVGINRLGWNSCSFQEIIQIYCQQPKCITASMLLLYETQSPELILSTFNTCLNTTETNYLKVELFAQSPLDLFVTGYCIPHSKLLWQYYIGPHSYNINVTSEHFKDLSKGLDISLAGNGGRIDKIEMELVTADKLTYLVSLHPHTQTLSELNITCYATSISQLAKVYGKFPSYYPSLKVLRISAEFSVELMRLFEALPRMCSLQFLSISLQSWPVDRFAAINDHLQECQTNLEHLTHLELVSGLWYGDGCSLSLVISKSLEYLMVHNFTLTPTLARCVGMKSFGLKTLKLDSCYIPKEACSALINALQSPHCVLQTFELTDGFGISVKPKLFEVLRTGTSSLKCLVLNSETFFKDATSGQWAKKK